MIQNSIFKYMGVLQKIYLRLCSNGIMHWNGTDLKYVIKLSNDFMYIPVPAIFEKDVFFGVQDGLNNVVTVVHGKLIE